MITKTKMIQVKDPRDVPEGRHYAVIIYATSNYHWCGSKVDQDRGGVYVRCHRDATQEPGRWLQVLAH